MVIVEQLGAEAHVICSLGGDTKGGDIKGAGTKSDGTKGDTTKVVVRQDATRPSPAIGEAVRITVDPAAVHLFDADGGTRL